MAAKSPKSENRRGQLQRESIVQTALALMNQIGLEALTLRRLADELQVQAPALYWHFKNKQELLNEMAEFMLNSAISSFVIPEDIEWSVWLTAMPHGLRKTLMSYRDGARLLASAEVPGTSMVSMDMTLGILVRAGFDYRQALVGTLTITNYVMGFVFEEQSSTLSQEEGVEGLRKLIERHNLTYLAAAFTEIKIPFDNNSEFEESITLIVDSLKTRLEKRRSEGSDQKA